MRNYLRKASLEQKIYKKQVGWRQRINRFLFALSLFAFLHTFSPAHRPGTTNGSQQTIVPRCTFLVIYVLWPSSLQGLVNVNLFSLIDSFFFKKRSFLTDLQPRSLYIHRGILCISKLLAILDVWVRQRVGKKNVEGLILCHAICQRLRTWSCPLSKAKNLVMPHVKIAVAWSAWVFSYT